MSKISVWAGLLLVMVCGAAEAQDRPTQAIPDMLARVRMAQDDTSRPGLLLRIADAYVLKPGEEKADLDSALLVIGQVKAANDKGDRDPRIAGLCELISSKAWHERRNDSLSRRAALRAVDLFRHQNDALDLAYAYCAAASHYDYSVHDQDSIRIGYYRQAIPIFDGFGRTEQQARFRELLGECLMNDNGAADALPPLLESLRIYQSMGRNDIRNVFSVLGACYGDIGDIQKAIEYELKALRLEEAHTPPEPSLITAYSRIGLTYVNSEQFESAIDMFREAHDWAMRFNRDDDAAYTGVNLTIALNSAGRKREALDTLRQIDVRYALEKNVPLQRLRAYLVLYLGSDRRDQLIGFGEKLAAGYKQAPSGSRYRVSMLIPLSRYALVMHQFDRAHQYAVEIIDASRRLSSMPNLVEGYRTLYRIDSARGDQDATFRAFRRYVEVRDSANDVTHTRQIAGLKVEYDMEKKDENIRLLTQSQQLSQAALRQAGIARNAILAAAVLLLVLLVVAVNRYRLKQRSNHLLQVQKTEIDARNAQLHKLVNEKEELLVIKDWLMRELNHRMGNNLHFMMSLQNMQANSLSSEEALNAITQSNNRLYAMSLIHRKLYQPESGGTINMRQYVTDLAQRLGEALSPGDHIELSTRVAAIELDVSQAIPVGLILNEAITNAYKYAFENFRPGSAGMHRPRIEIFLQTIGRAEVEVMVKDNGKGYFPPVGQGKRASLGFMLMEMLTKQLHGVLTILNEEGLTVLIQFPGKFQHRSESGQLAFSR